MTPARNLVSETKLQGPHGGKAAGGHPARDGDPKTNGDAFSALLGRAGGTATKQPAEASGASGQADTRATKKTREGNGAPRVPGSAKAAETAEEPVTVRAKSIPEPDVADKADNSLDALLAAMVSRSASVPGATATTSEVGDQSTASGGEGATVPANEASDTRAKASVSGSMEPGRSLDVSDNISIDAALPRALLNAGLQSGRDMVALDRDGVRTQSIATAAATAVPALAYIDGLKSRGSKVEFVSLRTDFEPAELRRARSDEAGGKVASQANLSKPGFASAIGRLAVVDSGNTAEANVGTNATSDGDRTEKSAAPKLPLFETGKATSPANATSADAADTSQIAPGRGRAGASDGTRDAVSPLATAQQASDPAGRIRATAPNTRRAGADGTGPASHAVSVESRSQGPAEATSALTHQVASAVGAQISTLVPSASAPKGDAAALASNTTTSENLRFRAGGAALKTLQIQLQPENLGTLDITMKLVSGQLAIHLAASEASTALRLKDDADGLKKLLTKSGFDVDDAAITVSARDGATGRVGNAFTPHNGSGPNTGQAGGQAGGNGQGFGPAGQGGANGDPQSRRQNAPSGNRADGTDPTSGPASEADGRATRNGGAVYL